MGELGASRALREGQLQHHLAPFGGHVGGHFEREGDAEGLPRGQPSDVLGRVEDRDLRGRGDAVRLEGGQGGRHVREFIHDGVVHDRHRVGDGLVGVQELVVVAPAEDQIGRVASAGDSEEARQQVGLAVDLGLGRRVARRVDVGDLQGEAAVSLQDPVVRRPRRADVDGKGNGREILVADGVEGEIGLRVDDGAGQVLDDDGDAGSQAPGRGVLVGDAQAHRVGARVTDLIEADVALGIAGVGGRVEDVGHGRDLARNREAEGLASHVQDAVGVQVLAARPRRIGAGAVAVGGAGRPFVDAFHVADVVVKAEIVVGVFLRADVLGDGLVGFDDPHRPNPRLQLAVGGRRVAVGVGREVNRFDGIRFVVDIDPARRSLHAPLPHDGVERVVDVAVVKLPGRGLHLEVQVVDQQVPGRIRPGQRDPDLPLGGGDAELVVDLRPGGVVDGRLGGPDGVPDDEPHGRMLLGVGKPEGNEGPVHDGERLGEDGPAVPLPVVPDDADDGQVDGPRRVHNRVVAVQRLGPGSLTDELLGEVGGSREESFDQRPRDVGDPIRVVPASGRVKALGEVVTDQRRFTGHGGGGEGGAPVVLIEDGLDGSVLVVVRRSEDGHPVGQGPSARGRPVVADPGDDGCRPKAGGGRGAFGRVVLDVLLLVEFAEHRVHVLADRAHGDQVLGGGGRRDLQRPADRLGAAAERVALGAALAVEEVGDEVAAVGQAAAGVADGADDHVVEVVGEELVDVVGLDAVDPRPATSSGKVRDAEGHYVKPRTGLHGRGHSIGEGTGIDVPAVLHHLRDRAFGLRARVLNHHPGVPGDSVHVDVGADIAREGRDGGEGAESRGVARDDPRHDVAVGAGAGEESVTGLSEGVGRLMGSHQLIRGDFSMVSAGD